MSAGFSPGIGAVVGANLVFALCVPRGPAAKGEHKVRPYAHASPLPRIRGKGIKTAAALRHGRSLFPRCSVRLTPSPMLRRFSHRLLTLLQLTRMALVFTAIADTLC